MRFIGLFSAVSVIFLAGCSNAQKASEVSSIRMPVAPYLKMDCNELASEMTVLVKDAEVLRSQVDSSYESDKTKEAVTWLLFAPAAFFMDGNAEETGRLATLKGQIEAVQEAQKINKCSL